MSILSSLLKLVHIFGLALAVGTGTAKLVLLLKCKAEPACLHSYLRLSKTITRLIIVGIMMLVLSGAGWLLLGYPLTSRLVVKIALVVVMFVLGLIIDNVVEPRFRRLASIDGGPASPAFLRIQDRQLGLELLADLLFYAIIVMWVLR